MVHKRIALAQIGGITVDIGIAGDRGGAPIMTGRHRGPNVGSSGGAGSATFSGDSP